MRTKKPVAPGGLKRRRQQRTGKTPGLGKGGKRRRNLIQIENRRRINEGRKVARAPVGPDGLRPAARKKLHQKQEEQRQRIHYEKTRKERGILARLHQQIRRLQGK